MHFANIQVPEYCENLDWFVNQPINVASNLLFVILAVIAYRRAGSRFLRYLSVTLGTVGLGSAAFHILGGAGTLWMDVVPIYVFILSALGYWVWLLTRSVRAAVTTCILFVVAQVILSLYVPSGFANGSIRHIFTLTVLLGLGLWTLRKTSRQNPRWLVLTVVSYALAIFFRASDQALCDVVQTGVHFLWHVFAASTGFSATLFLIQLCRIVKP